MRIAQSRFVTLMGQGARLERALINFMLDLHGGKGYREVLPPILVNSASLTGSATAAEVHTVTGANVEIDVLPVEDLDLLVAGTAVARKRVGQRVFAGEVAMRFAVGDADVHIGIDGGVATGTHLLNKFSWGIAPSGFYVRNNFVGVPVHQYGAIIKPVHAKALRFRTRQAATKSNPRGKFNPFQFRQSVRIPRRQMMPEADTGGLGNWGPRLNTAADGFLQRTMGW